MLTVLRNIALEVVLLMTRLLASVLEHGFGLIIEPMKELFQWLSSMSTDLRLWFYDVANRLRALIKE